MHWPIEPANSDRWYRIGAPSFPSVEGDGFETTRPESLMASGKSGIGLPGLVQRLRRKMHSPGPTESNRSRPARFSRTKTPTKSAGFWLPSQPRGTATSIRLAEGELGSNPLYVGVPGSLAWRSKLAVYLQRHRRDFHFRHQTGQRKPLTYNFDP